MKDFLQDGRTSVEIVDTACKEEYSDQVRCVIGMPA